MLKRIGWGSTAVDDDRRVFGLILSPPATRLVGQPVSADTKG